MLEVLERNIRENAREYAIRVLYHNIINMNLEPGQQISESEISKVLGISRTPVREALIELSKLSLVEIYPQRGTYISKIDMDRVEESRFARCVLEKAVVKLACKMIDEKYEAEIEENLKLQEISAKKKDFKHLLFLDNKFHELIFKACNKEATFNLIRSMMSHFDRVRILNFVKMDMNRTVNDHKKIYYAIKERDEKKAEELMEEHLTRVVFDQEYLKKLHPEYFK
ncbi:GntR family transcriptional regulator [Thermovorax subterraneus]|jgi:DNA-binding GntR family transcriptional regulator|nr:GntR family transcriptional regulator [Thermovorax subterraneus]